MSIRLALATAFLLAATPGASGWAQHPAPPAATAPTTPAQWGGDLDALLAALERMHPGPFHRYPRERFEAQIADLRANLTHLTREQAVVGIMRAVASLGDGHTSVPADSLASIGFRAMPLRFYAYPDGLYLQAADRRYARAVGGRLVSIGGVPAEEVARRVGELVPHDNSQTVLGRLPAYMIIPELLEGLGIISDADAPVRMRFRVGSRIVTINVTADATPSQHDNQIAALYSGDWVDSMRGEPPLWLRDGERNYWMEYLADQRTLYVQYNRVFSDPQEPIGRFARRMREEIAARGAERVVLDLRHNPGGDAYWNRSLYLALLRAPQLERPGSLIILIGRNTYSAAMMLAIDLERYANPVFIGEPTAGRIQGYGNHDHVVLPASGLMVMVSVDFYQNAGPRDDRIWIAPEAAVDLTAADYVAGRDPVLDAALAYRPTQERLAQALARSVTQAAYDRFMAEPINRYLNAEPALIALGYEALRANDHSRAVALFEIATRAYPHSANAFDSLGDGLRAANRIPEAIAAYRRALEIMPNYSPSQRSLAELEGRSAH